MKKDTLRVVGMGCGGCAATVRKSLAQLHGVHSAEVDFASSVACVEYDESVLSSSLFVDAVRAVGYDVELPALN